MMQTNYTQKRLTGRYYFKRNWLGFLILYVEERCSEGGSPLYETYRKATEKDIIHFRKNLKP